MTQMLAQREHDYFAETVICANCYIVAKIYEHTKKIRAHALSWSMGAKATCLIVSETKGYLFTPAGNADLDKTLAYGLIRVRR